MRQLLVIVALARIHRETPQQFVRRVKRAWRTAKQTAPATTARTRWARAA